MARPKALEPNLPMTVSVPVSLKTEFLALCLAHDVQASQVLRVFIRQYVAEQKSKVVYEQGD